MTNVYSQPFISFQGLGGSTDDVVVPDGFTYVVKQLTFYSSPLLGTVYARFKSTTSGATLFATAAQAEVPTWSGFYGALVFLTGEAFKWEMDTALTDECDVYAGGYALLNP